MEILELDKIMTQEHRKLLLKDICARLPYGVKGIITYNGDKDIFTVEGIFNILFLSDTESCHVEDFRPYLFPLSSMTKEQFLELTDLCNMYDDYNDYDPHEYWGIQVCRKHIHRNNLCFSNNYETIDWFNKNHFDYRGLIEKGLAIDATGLNIY